MLGRRLVYQDHLEVLEMFYLQIIHLSHQNYRHTQSKVP